MEPFDSIEKLINEHGSAAILRERIELAKEQHIALANRVTELTKELETVKGHNELLRQKLLKVSVPDEFFRQNGLLWRRSDSGFESAPYCPKCKIVMFDFPPRRRMFWNCSVCEMTAGWQLAPTEPGAA
ncbi:MAG: hypothetical protein ABIT76_06695 [Chthoniobacterales bacterium]